MGRKAKATFDDLDSDFKDSVASMADEDVKKKVSEVALTEHENPEAQTADQDLEAKKREHTEAGAQYREASKANKLKIKYCHALLESRGKVP